MIYNLESKPGVFVLNKSIVPGMSHLVLAGAWGS